MSSRELTCLLMGDESLLIQCAEILRSRGHSLAAVVTADASIRDWARSLDIAVHQPGPDLERSLAIVEYDWFFGIANLRIVPDPVWRKARRGAANFHDGPLPRYAGLNAPTWAILGDEAQHGVTWHALTSGIDEGDVYAQQIFDILPSETALTLNAKCYEAAIQTFGLMLDGIESGGLAPQPQDLSQRSYFGKHDRPAAAATLRFDRPAAELDALVRALDYGPGYANPLVLPKLRTAAGLLLVGALELTREDNDGAEPGTVLGVDVEGATIAAADRPVRVSRLTRSCGTPVKASELLQVGSRSIPLEEDASRRLTAAVGEVVGSEVYYLKKLRELRRLDLPGAQLAADGSERRLQSIPVNLPPVFERDARIGALAAYLVRASGQEQFDLGYRDDALAALCREFPGYFSETVPLHVDAHAAPTGAALTEAIQAELLALRKRRAYLADLVARRPELSMPRYAVGIAISPRATEDQAIPGCDLTFVLSSESADVLACFDASRLPARAAEAFLRRLDVALAALAENSHGTIEALPLMSDEELLRVLRDWNRTEQAYDHGACVHALVERQVDATPDAIALAFEGEQITYAELDRRANRIAHALRNLGVGADALVGLHARRSLELVVGALGIQKAGAAYVPLDPAYPANRLALMIEDSGAPVVLTQRELLGSLPATPRSLLCFDDDAVQNAPSTRPPAVAASANLAYVIYTSGSTGRPKGVMIEHRNVVNFFAGMDARLPAAAETQPVWVAVTSLSFDISVLELFWTLTRGFKVVISSDEDRAAAPAGSHVEKPMDFGLFYWGNDDGPGPQKYRLLLEGAKFADSHGFHAVWTPERHFHAFGGPYPNPSVTGAAVAAVTQRVHIRAGSCVVPLHHPARVAEEWSVLDNLSNGRVGVSFASGWMPEDFLLRPENAPPGNKAAMVRDIDVVRRLWRGEAVPFDSPTGASVPVVTQPRPVQKELPVWVTTAGNPETYREAARLGANVLTHLLGQSIEELAGKIVIYRETLAAEGRDPAQHKVTLMLHTLVGSDREQVKEMARGPMKDYLRSAAALIKQYAWAFPAFKKPAGLEKPMDIDLRSLAADEMDAILEFAFLRYFEDSGLFGTITDAVARVDQLKGIGVDEIACLIDFGVASDVALAGLQPLAEVVRRTSRPAPAREPGADYSIAALIERHGATHLQCTPSMVRMFAMNDAARRALPRVRHFFIGGEALPGSLVEELQQLAPAATVDNMYGPTETTIWSTMHRAAPGEGTVPLGRPIANTQVYVLDERLRPAPPGTAGELCIGGDGVARGYLHREELTRDRFLPDPFRAGGRIYRTGDLVRFAEDGVLHFLGRVDFQVKVRGYRIELGEIEGRLAVHPAIRESVVVAREDRPGDVRLVAYLRWRSAPIADDALRAHLRETLPEHMLPAHFVALESFPLTPNAKVDRKALPKPEAARPVDTCAAAFVPPASDVQRKIAEIYKQVLGVPQVGLEDNFFKLGGHSLLAVRAHREMQASVASTLTITDIFRFPTVAALAAHVDGSGRGSEQLEQVADRAAARRDAMARRRGARWARNEN